MVGWPMLSRLLDQESALRCLEEVLPLFQGPHGARLGAVRLRDVRLGKWWQLQYLLHIQAGEGRASQQIVTCHVGPQERLSRTALRAERLRENARNDNPMLAGLFAYRPEAGLLVVPFPLDPGLPQLVEATEPRQAARKLSVAAGGPDSIRRIEILRFVSGKRCQIRYHFRPGGAGSLLGKTFRDGRGRDLGALMNRVAELFEASGNPELSAPRSPGYLPQWQMVLQEDVGGVTLYGQARNGTLDEAHLTGAAECLATLHGSSLRVPGRHLVDDEIALVRSARDRLRQAGCASPATGPLLAQLAEYSRGLPAGRLVPVHRDFYDKQILVQGSRLFLIDLDTATTGFPEIDVANFIAHLRLRSLQQQPGPLPGDREERFFDAYARAATTPDPRRMCFFLAAALFRLGCVYRLRSQRRRLATRLFELSGAELSRVHPGAPARSLVRER